MENKEPTKEDSEGRPDFGFEYLDHTVRLFLYFFQLCQPVAYFLWDVKFFLKCVRYQNAYV